LRHDWQFAIDRTGVTFVVGFAVPHPYELHLGAYSVHTSADALVAGERNLRELKKRLDATGIGARHPAQRLCSGGEHGMSTTHGRVCGLRVPTRPIIS
jgi:hypothetical protein